MENTAIVCGLIGERRGGVGREYRSWVGEKLLSAGTISVRSIVK